MSTDAGPRVGEVLPDEAWRILEQDPEAVLVDVRTQAEWGFVGVPDLTGIGRSATLVEWASLPDMSADPRFVTELMDRLGDGRPGTMLFICRSGARSRRAAEAAAAHLADKGRPAVCLNVAEGFEGDLDRDGHRGGVNGWKARGLPWRQS